MNEVQDVAIILNKLACFEKYENKFPILQIKKKKLIDIWTPFIGSLKVFDYLNIL